MLSFSAIGTRGNAPLATVCVADTLHTASSRCSSYKRTSVCMMNNPIAWWRLHSPQLLPAAASERNSSPLLTL